MMKLFRKPTTETAKTETLAEMLKRGREATLKVEVAGKTFVTYWKVCDLNNNYKTVAEGFKSKAECREYCDKLTDVKWYMFPYEVEE